MSVEFCVKYLANPTAFILETLPEMFYSKVVKGEKSLQYGGRLDKKLFEQFRAQFNCILITSPLPFPRNECGGRVRLFLNEEVKDVEVLEWKNFPDHHMTICTLHYLQLRYGYRKTQDHFTVEETFFFEFASRYSLSNFADLNSPFSFLRYFSSILHRLDIFKVTFVENGVYVNLHSRINDSYKPAFAMNR